MDVPSAKPDQHIHDFRRKSACRRRAFAVAYAILKLTDAQIATARALNKLGVAEAPTRFGAMENLAMQLTRAGEAVAGAVSEVGSTIGGRCQRMTNGRPLRGVNGSSSNDNLTCRGLHRITDAVRTARGWPL
jgi:hypothetical protein